MIQNCDARFFRLRAIHIPDILALERLCFSMPWNEAQFVVAFQQKHFAVFGLQTTSIIAYISFYHTREEIEILNIAVHPDQRRQGFGMHLVNMTLKVAQKMGIAQAVLEVRVSNVEACALYDKLMFHVVGVRPRYYADTNEDALVYACDLTKK